MTQLPPEIIDQILLNCDVSIAIQLGNEHVKQKLLHRLRLPKLWRSKDAEAIAWLRKYDIKGEFDQCPRQRLNFSHPVKELVWVIGISSSPVPYRMTAEEERAKRDYLAREEIEAKVRAAEGRARTRARRQIKIEAVKAFHQRAIEIQRGHKQLF